MQAKAVIEARLLHALAEAEGALPPGPLPGPPIPPGERDRVTRGLEAAGLVRVGPDGLVRSGERGSLLSAARAKRSGLPSRLGRPLEIRAVVSSTNEAVLERAGEGELRGFVLGAELQTAGRGRRGRTFDSRPGLGLWFTVVLEAPRDPARAPRAALVTGLAVAAALEAETGRRAEVKWPNDVYMEGRKTGGILVEARTAGRRPFPVAGIGVNVHHRPGDFPDALRAVAGSVESASRMRVDRSALLARILTHLEAWVARDASGALDLPREFAKRDGLRGREIEIRGAGKAVHRGEALGIDDGGELLLREAGGGVRIVRSGDASVVP
jgi:BirA family biotin operon repressor/biotin-[acetyl-CoA-carboxylase] ligase